MEMRSAFVQFKASTHSCYLEGLSYRFSANLIQKIFLRVQFMLMVVILIDQSSSYFRLRFCMCQVASVPIKKVVNQSFVSVSISDPIHFANKYSLSLQRRYTLLGLRRPLLIVVS